MSYYEALADNIKIGLDKFGFRAYYPKCHICGNELMSWSYIRTTKYRCKDCKDEEIDVVEQLSENLRKSEKQRKLDMAIKKINKMANIKHYEKGIKWVEKNLGKTNWFQSSEEIMVALELIRKGVKANHQVKVNKYRVDFMLPKEKVVLEIDGNVFHRHDTKGKERFRDNIIILALGAEWEVVRIPTEHINKNITKLCPALNALIKRRKNQRLWNKGKLAKGYSSAT